MVFRGCIHNGIVVLEESVPLAEGTPVIVHIADEPPSAVSDDPVYRLGELAVPTGIVDLAMNVDHYLYGHPKPTDVES